MGVGFSQALQTGLFDLLSGDLELSTMAAIYDAPPVLSAADAEADYVTLGEEAVKPLGPAEDGLIAHDVDIVIHSPAHGFGRVKGIGARIDTLLTGAIAAVAAARIVDIRFLRAKADRGVGVDRRRMRLTYRVVLEPAAT